MLLPDLLYLRARTMEEALSLRSNWANWGRWYTMLLACLLLAGCSGNGDPVCEDTSCTYPPADECVDGDTLREHDPQGSCSPAGVCVYGYAERTCEHGCSNARCGSPDPCYGVVCDQPPANECQDGTTLRIYDAVGVCLPADGSCDYGFRDQTCENSCEDGDCVAEDLCAGVVCDQPPPATCLDALTIVEYDPVGTCDPATGRCDYNQSERACADGCLNDLCIELGTSHGLVIPAGTRVCSDNQSTWDIFGGYWTKMRITFVDGLVELPTDEVNFQRNWIASVEYGPERTLLTPVDPGAFSLSSVADRDIYQYVQNFTSGSEDYILRARFEFDVVAGERLIVFDELYLSPPLRFGVRTLDLSVTDTVFGSWYFVTCRYSLYQPIVHRVTTEDGGQLEIEERLYISDDCMLACPTALVRASCTWDLESREVDDHFRLSFVDGQHNWYEQFVAMFDESVGPIHGIFYFPADDQQPELTVVHLDANLDPVGSSVVTEHITLELVSPFDSQTSSATSCAQWCQENPYRDACDNGCPVEDRTVAGRCLPSYDFPYYDWMDLSTCDQIFDACVQAGYPYIQCCCSRAWSQW